MREVHCRHCKATNRRPKCGSCQKEIADPPAIALVWKLYQHRKFVRLASTFVVVTILSWEAFYYFYPATSADCQEQAARSARSNDALRVLLRLCYERFPSKP